MNTSNNPFWLEVKKEYIRDNFDNLVKYLKNCSPDSIKYQNDNDESSDFNRTYKALQEAALDSLSVLVTGKSIAKTIKLQWETISCDIRTVATYLLTCKIKGCTDFKVLAQFADFFVLAEFATTNDLLMKLRKIVMNCAIEAKLETFGFSWNTIQEWNNLTAETFCSHLGNTCFSESAVVGYYEGKGLLVCEKTSVNLFPFNKQQYYEYRRQDKLFPQISQDIRLLAINVTRNEKRIISSFEDIEQIGRDLVLQQKNTKPSFQAKMKIYSEDDELVVRVTDFYQYGIIAESIDNAYNKVSGKVYIDKALQNKYNIDIDDIKRFVKKGDCIIVKLQNKQNIPFALSEGIFSEYYKFIANNCDRITDAVYKGKYTFGSQWITKEGLIVNIFGEDEINDGPITIEIQETKNDRSGNFIINGSYYDDTSSFNSKEELKEQMKKNMVKGFVDYSLEKKPAKNNVNNTMMLFDKSFTTILSHIYYRLSQHCTSAKKHYELLIASYMLSIMSDSNEESEFIKFEMDYLSNLVRFAKGDTPSLLSINSNEKLLTSNKVVSNIEIIKLLQKYSIKGTDYRDIEISQMTEDEKYSYLRRMVIASNILIGKTSLSEINRIKKSIAIFLGVEEEYKNILPDMTYYGEESDTLEFKTSIVFSPKSKTAEPNIQKWAILTTICGFMNTLSGGELLLGVNDDGYSKGLIDDINYLYENKKIEKNMDSYRLYIKYIVDHAFMDDANNSKELEITTGRIQYFIETNKENHTILRIQVRPYEYGIVLFNNSEGRPNNIEQSYYRTSGATVPMTEELKRQAKERKINASYDGNLRKYIKLQQACKENKQAKLIQYTSHSGTKDRVVEPYKALPEHNAFLCYDVEKKEIREYKIARAKDVEILSDNWMYPSKHRNLTPDIFGLIPNQTETPYEIVLKLKPLAYNLLIEEYKNAKHYITENKDEIDKREYPWIFKAMICKSEGIGRFYIGLANSIKIVSGDQLREYVLKYKELYLSNL